MFDNFKKFRGLWESWVKCDCAKALCDDEDKNEGMEKYDCYNVPEEFFYSQCAAVNDGKCTKVCRFFIAQSVKFRYRIVKAKNNKASRKYRWILVSAYIYNEKDCDSFIGYIFH